MSCLDFNVDDCFGWKIRIKAMWQERVLDGLINVCKHSGTFPKRCTRSDQIIKCIRDTCKYCMGKKSDEIFLLSFILCPVSFLFLLAVCSLSVTGLFGCWHFFSCLSYTNFTYLFSCIKSNLAAAKELQQKWQLCTQVLHCIDCSR